MKSVFLCRIHEAKINEKISGFDRINDSLSITNDSDYLKSLIAKEVPDIIGKMEWEDLLSGNLVAFACENLDPQTSTKNHIVEKLFSLQSFISTIWLHVDNSINLELGFLVAVDGISVKVESNYLATKFSNSNGKISPVEFTRNEFSKIRKFYRENIKFDNSISSTKISKNYERADRALYMISAARSENDLGLKIANYCTVLEALLSTSQSELSHQVAERLAFFVGKSPDERMEIYRNAKKAYGIRSKVVHGDTISGNDINKLEEISEFCDNSIRRIFQRIYLDRKIHDIINDSSLIDRYMLELIMGKQTNVFADCE